MTLKKILALLLLTSLVSLNGCSTMGCNLAAPHLEWTKGPNNEVILTEDATAELINWIEDVENCEG
ncbi:TPA: hypothetical protein ACX3EJ_001052 [Vibrio parahaemolyticus]|uniref:hypothetical protein n=1 Tax=Vibrio parahaemolyticus TaxID=670 RepID=UPI001131B059|nr:hypothetical protein [Vibrio parahaemolyticus]EGQ8030268.1 hypothetical protein [Vibrio parahaemolyticus]EHV9720263.1 hypothetical protein [Vibrio parahaemolyticus]HCG6030297.1 hypothetical protein [Vibrio parahaemolyticus]HDF8527434.1 hypothetical protein [Vibrio parahaemolyticus]